MSSWKNRYPARRALAGSRARTAATDAMVWMASTVGTAATDSPEFQVEMVNAVKLVAMVNAEPLVATANGVLPAKTAKQKTRSRSRSLDSAATSIRRCEHELARPRSERG